ncbi:putative AAA family ATPase YTA6 KNAG_0A01960 [Huiozyma naganishii CBS 8797]|uniref:AAA+ ATPase domain-containing protein n=1 Tax=Huiozyma naganishii (strain ATCC MYA-139 / BCRC 22969 / CBS 8797 / KCTC 17520 / NBRC 10181 / NCYC 3082 / Yp74L-3) TaxID=1071383 RepID=J7QZI3_HUIN7|nr:hypothetical protein KNAG_0A01960 [Kazachstania naganishii CBS 8797]CCK67885.1 hypothetical protein KNAG_0A01960 [Kazachstania naganishii CBS 8797]
MVQEKFIVPRNLTLSQCLELLYSVVLNQYENLKAECALIKKSQKYKNLSKLHKSLELLLEYVNDGLKRVEKSYAVQSGWGNYIKEHAEFKVIMEDFQILGHEIRVIRREVVDIMEENGTDKILGIWRINGSMKKKLEDEEKDTRVMQNAERIKEERRRDLEAAKLEREQKLKEQKLMEQQLEQQKERLLELRIKQQVETQMTEKLQEEKRMRKQLELKNEEKLEELRQKMLKNARELANQNKAAQAISSAKKERRSLDIQRASNTAREPAVTAPRRSLNAKPSKHISQRELNQSSVNKAAVLAWSSAQRNYTPENSNYKPTTSKPVRRATSVSVAPPVNVVRRKTEPLKIHVNKPLMKSPTLKSPATRKQPQLNASTNSAQGTTANGAYKVSSKILSSSVPSSPRIAQAGAKARSQSPPSALDPGWPIERRIAHIMKTLNGVDPIACQQIVNDIMITDSKVYWDDIAGLRGAKNALKEIVVYPFLRPDLFKGLREPISGMLLFGPPGTGKTMIAKAIATEANSTFFSISASSLLSKYLGESEKLVKALFYVAKRMAPSIIFIDEIDSLLGNRSDNENESSRRIKTELLIQWSELSSAAVRDEDGDTGTTNGDAAPDSRVLVLSATNLPWVIDEAARRRFTRRLYIPLPDPETRAYHLRKLMSKQRNGLLDEDFDEIVAATDGYSGSDITALAKEAAMEPIRDLGDKLMDANFDTIRPVNKQDFVNAMKTIKKSVSKDSLKQFNDWASHYGSVGS